MKINVDFIYPIGSVYISTQSTNPSVLFGGKWVQTAKSRAIVGAGSNIANTDTTYGSLSAGTLNFTAGTLMGESTHTLSIQEIPSHSHDLTVHSGGTTAAPIAGVANTANALGNGLLTNPSYRIQNTGGSQAHNNIMPIEVYYIWKRVS